MARRNISAEIAVESTELRAIRQEETDLLKVVQYAKITPYIKWLAITIKRILHLEERVKDLVKKEIQNDGQIVRIEYYIKDNMAGSGLRMKKELSKLSKEILKLQKEKNVFKKRVRFVEKEILALERKVLAKIPKSDYKVYKEMLETVDLTYKDFVRLERKS